MGVSSVNVHAIHSRWTHVCPCFYMPCLWPKCGVVGLNYRVHFFFLPLHKERETERIEVYKAPCMVFHIEMACGFRRAAIAPARPHSGHICVTVGQRHSLPLVPVLSAVELCQLASLNATPELQVCLLSGFLEEQPWWFE